MDVQLPEHMFLVSEQPKLIETFAKCEDAKSQRMKLIVTELEMIDHDMFFITSIFLIQSFSILFIASRREL